MHTSVAILLTITLTLWWTSSVNTMAITEPWICEACATRAECDAYPKESCVWGEARNACNRRICAKGPGERCGGSLNILGVCGEGMMCKSDERCHGCSIQTMECYNGSRN